MNAVHTYCALAGYSLLVIAYGVELLLSLTAHS